MLVFSVTLPSSLRFARTVTRAKTDFPTRYKCLHALSAATQKKATAQFRATFLAVSVALLLFASSSSSKGQSISGGASFGNVYPSQPPVTTTVAFNGSQIIGGNFQIHGSSSQNISTGTVSVPSSFSLSGQGQELQLPVTFLPNQTLGSISGSLTFSFTCTFDCTKGTSLSVIVQLNGQRLSQPATINSGPACAASASGAGQTICVVGDGNNELLAVWQTEKTNGGVLENTAITYFGLGVSGTVGNSSCSSVDDATGDTVCAYQNGTTLFGIRFNVGNGPNTTSPTIWNNPKTLLSSVTGNASCTIGNPRFRQQLADNAQARAGEPHDDDTICAVRTSNNELTGIAFNPATNMAPVTVAFGASSTVDPNCTNPKISGGNQPNLVTCVANNNGALRGVTFDPRTSGSTTTPYAISVISGGSTQTVIGIPGCSGPMDGTGDVLCAVSNSADALYGVRFTPPAAGAQVSSVQPYVQLLGGVSTGDASCAGLGTLLSTTDQNSHQIVCAVRGTTDLYFGFEFDPKAGSFSNFTASNARTNYPSSPNSFASDPSCTFQNVNTDTVSCSGAGTVNTGTPTPAELFVIPAIPPTVL
jgi:hypothetical protein